MKPHIANFINGIVLLIMGLWGYFTTQSPTALIAPVFGIIFLGLNNWLKKENKVVAHIIVVLTLLLIIALFKPLSGALNDGDTLGLIRVGIMMLTSVFAFSTFIRSFINARKK